MRTLTTMVLAIISLAGCAGTHTPAVFGNFIEAPVHANDKMMAGDVASKLGALYPPARTSIKMQQATPDVFGATLIAALRGKGYALAEFDAGQSVDTLDGSAATQTSADNLALAYVVDQPLNAGVYRVTVLVNGQSLSRLYQARDGSIVPAGYWVRKE
jgi:hypothetical protein